MEYKPVVRDGKPAEAAVITCLDPDFNHQNAYPSVIDELVSEKYDLISVAGASLAIVDEEYLTRLIKMAHGLHDFPTAYILDHINCKAFGIHDENEELNEHKKTLKLASEILKNAIPGLKVKGHVLGWDKVIYSMPD